MKKELVVLFLGLFLMATVAAATSDIVIWTNSGEKAIAKVYDGSEQLQTPIATPYETGLNTLTVNANTDEVTLNIFVLKNGATLRSTEYDIKLGEDYEFDFKGTSLKLIDRAESEAVVEVLDELNVENDTLENLEEGNETSSFNITTLFSGFTVSDLNNNYIKGTAAAVVVLGLAAFFMIRKKKDLDGHAEKRPSRAIRKIKFKVSREDSEIEEIQKKIKEKQVLISELRQEKERELRLKDAREKLEKEEAELARLMREQKK